MPGGRPAYKPSDRDRKQVSAMSGYGIPHADIAAALGISINTLRKHFKKELRTGATIANSTIGQRLYAKAMAGDTTALIWWTKARMGWSDKTRTELTGADGGPVQVDMSTMSDEDLERIANGKRPASEG